MAARPATPRPATAVLAGFLAVLAASVPAAAAPSPWGQAGDDIDGERSRHLRIGLIHECAVAPAPNGFWTAGHCLQHGGRLAITGERITGYSLDPARDLGHIAAAGSPPSIPATTAAIGETVTARLFGGADTALVYHSARSCVLDHGAIVHAPGAQPGGWPCALTCARAGRDIRTGDSGTGVWSHGSVWGVVVAADLDRPRELSACAEDQAVIVVVIP